VKGVAPLTPLIAAAEDGLTDFYKPLLAAGADPDVRDDVWFSFSCFVLLLCACSSHYGIIVYTQEVLPSN
jgi:hypothetical protein